MAIMLSCNNGNYTNIPIIQSCNYANINFAIMQFNIHENYPLSHFYNYANNHFPASSEFFPCGKVTCYYCHEKL